MKTTTTSFSFLLFLFFTTNLLSQDWSFELSVPLVSHKLTNVDEIRSDFNSEYFNDQYIPNFRFTSKYKKIIASFDYYNHDYHTSLISVQEFASTTITNKVNALSLLLGYQLLDNRRINISVGSGLSYQKHALSTFFTTYTWEGYVFRKDNTLGATFWLSAKKQIYKNLNVSVNLRFNPMLKPCFDEDEESHRIQQFGHDRLNYLISQVSLGYQF